MRDRHLVLVALLAVAPQRAAAEELPAAEPEPPVVDVSKVKPTLRVFHDGKRHYLVLPLPKHGLGFGDHVYYGDGKVLYRQPVSNAARVGDTRLSAMLEDPRTLGRGSWFSIHDGKASYSCDDRTSPLAELAPTATRALLDGAVFRDVYWRRFAHALARDTRGVYYYVDRLAHGYTPQPPPLLDFHVFAGPRGKVKPLRMKNVISDPSGQIFVTASGKLRLVLDANSTSDPRARAHAAWHVGGRRTELTVVDTKLPQTLVLIYRELGMYTGRRLRRPCDDL